MSFISITDETARAPGCYLREICFSREGWAHWCQKLSVIFPRNTDWFDFIFCFLMQVTSQHASRSQLLSLAAHRTYPKHSLEYNLPVPQAYLFQTIMLRQLCTAICHLIELLGRECQESITCKHSEGSWRHLQNGRRPQRLRHTFWHQLAGPVSPWVRLIKPHDKYTLLN